MVKINVTQREIDLLKMCYNTMNLPVNYIIKDKKIIILYDEKERLYILFNCVLDTFLKIGLKDNDEPNEIGFELEELNKKINHEYVVINSSNKNTH